MNVLVVDDDLVSRMFVAQILGSFGVSCVDAADGFTALDILRTRCDEFDAVLCDQEMPGITGLELLSELRRFSDIDFILLTGYLERDELGPGVDDIDFYISKPVSSEEIKRVLNYLSERVTS